ncbi:MAG: hypothetical protein RLZZ113_1553, partial [Pseudomonadota bacterium]
MVKRGLVSTRSEAARLIAEHDLIDPGEETPVRPGRPIRAERTDCSDRASRERTPEDVV